MQRIVLIQSNLVLLLVFFNHYSSCQRNFKCLVLRQSYLQSFKKLTPVASFCLSVGVFKNGRVEIIANDQGNRITPSYVAFTPEGERLIGDGAKNQLTSNPENTVFDAKRLIGRNWDDPSVQHDLKFFPFKLVKKNDKPHVQLNVKGESKEFAAEEISAMVLTKMKVTFSLTESVCVPGSS